MVLCVKPNSEQSRSWNMLVDLAEDYPELYRDGVLWAGAHLYRCGLTSN